MYVEDGGGFEKERKWSDYKELKKKNSSSQSSVSQVYYLAFIC